MKPSVQAPRPRGPGASISSGRQMHPPLTFTPLGRWPVIKLAAGGATGKSSGPRSPRALHLRLRHPPPYLTHIAK